MITLSFTFYMSSFILISNSLPYFSYLCSPTPVTWSILSLSTGFRIHMWISVLSENTIYGGIFSRRAISVRSSRSFWKSGWSSSVSPLTGALRFRDGFSFGFFSCSFGSFICIVLSCAKSSPIRGPNFTIV